MARSLVGSSASGPYARKLRLLEAQRAHLRAAVEIRQTLPALERERGERPPPPYVAGGSLRSRGSPVDSELTVPYYAEMISNLVTRLKTHRV